MDDYEWIEHPLNTIEQIFRENELSSYKDKIQTFFQTKLETAKIDERVPSLNDVPFHRLSNNSLVQFRCMIQDMFDPEFYFEIYNTRNLQTNKLSSHLGRFRENVACPPGCDIQYDCSTNITLDRHTLYCIPIPGETDWVKKQGLQTMCVYNIPSTSRPLKSIKRPHDDVTNDIATPQPITASETNMAVDNAPEEQDVLLTTTSTDCGKRLKCENTQSDNSGMEWGQPGFNFPLPHQTGPVCLAKVYNNSDYPMFKLNDVVVFYGVLTFQPNLNPQSIIENESLCEMVDPTSGLHDDAHQRMLPSLFPRLHVLHYKQLLHINPTLPQTITNPDRLLEELVPTRTDVYNILLEVLNGDSLAAEYLLLHLMSHVYARKDILSLGQMCVNLSQIPPGSSLPNALNKLLQVILEKCFMFEMSLSVMNECQLKPKKDYTNNRLISAILQLSDRTNFLLNETALQPGQLNNNGVNNVQSLSDLISWQKVQYDFGYHTTDFTTNIAVLILSEGKSLLPSDCHVPLSVPSLSSSDTTTAWTCEDVVDNIISTLHGSMLTRIRQYLTVVKQVQYQLSTTAQQMVQDDFVEMRKQEPNHTTAEDLHRLLTIARLVSLSESQTNLTEASWNKAKRLEAERKRRVQLLPITPHPTNMEE